MTKLRQPISILLLFHTFLFLQTVSIAQTRYDLYIKGMDKDSAFLVNNLGFPTSFPARSAAEEYINKLPALLHSKGYITASLDSVRYDSSFARIVLFLGEGYQWTELNTSKVEPAILEAVGWREKNFREKPMDFGQLNSLEEKILQHLENTGYPFARVWLDSMQLSEGRVNAILMVDKGPEYKIDSIRVFGDVRVSNQFLQRYLDIPEGARYNKQKLLNISKKVRELGYVEETRRSDLSMLPTGSVLNLYLKPRRTSQVNVLLGFLPNSDQLSDKKLLITGEGNLHLKNAFGAGESIGFSFQKLQIRSQRLNVFYQHPYLFNSPIGLDFAFDMYRKDSIYLNINFRFGASYILSETQTGRLYIQRFQSIANGINTAYILQHKRLADEADVSSFNLGVDYEINTTDYNRNPRRGNELLLSTTVGTKKIRKNNQVLELQDPNDPGFDFGTLYDTVKLKTYQFRVKTMAAKYFPWGRQGTIKTAVNAGIFQSGNIFRNELFQIGGFKLLRGFDEESQFVSQYAIATVEYHYIIGLNSYFYALLDGGWARNNSQNNEINYNYVSTGLGLAFETRVGIFNLSWAIGRRNDIPFNLRQSKIHFGFVNYF